MLNHCIQPSKCRTFTTKSLFNRRFPITTTTTPTISSSPRLRNTPQSTPYKKSLSAAFSTNGNNLLDNVTPPNETKSSIDPDLRKLKKLVGLPCPGCGSTFQMKNPEEPGYLTRISSEPTTPEPTPKIPEESPKPAFDPNATTMSHEQYEEHLKSLDPKILEEMGLQIPAKPKSRRPTPAPYATTETLDQESNESEGKEDTVLEKKPRIKPISSRVICQRCHSLSHHNSPLASLSVLPSVFFPSPPAPVPKHIATLKQSKSATVVLVVDLVDFPLSLPQPVIQELLKYKKPIGYVNRKDQRQGSTPIIVVGNKFDVMPNGTQKYKIAKNLHDYFEKHGLGSNIKSIHILSAKNPSGEDIRMLLKNIGTVWGKYGKGNVVMVGAENVGKSQLLNAFLEESGRWRPNNIEVESQKHGAKQLERQKKLSALLSASGGVKKDDDDDGDDDDEDKEWDTMTGKDSVGADIEKYKVLYTERGLEKIKLYETTVSNVPGTTLEKIKVPLRVLKKYMGGDYKEVDSKWLMDTPGIRSNEGLLTNWLTLEELKVSLPKKMLKPASFLLEEGRSFFLGGLVRIDCISIGKGPSPQRPDRPARVTPSGRLRGSAPSPKLTVFTSLPLHITSIERANGFMQKTANGELTALQPPFGSPERLKAFPGLAPALEGNLIIVNEPLSSQPATRFDHGNESEPLPERNRLQDPFSKLDDRFSAGLEPIDEDGLINPWNDGREYSRKAREDARLQLAGQYGICDLVFSGIGWVMVSGKFRGEQQAVTLKIWTPKGEGIAVRERCFLPELADSPLEKTAGGIRQNRKIFARLENGLRWEDKAAKETKATKETEGVKVESVGVADA
ncbi:hypothetical protein BGZ49_008294 [Haplosporangium sp. Z 27]|nr:hypothetical protein BGZ49_008294 [Haplosporangium sp. Z 27]